tara:strand:- start:2000 stop:3505 length:1506 start_codon:yes stop_codon:yes gene_type:complete
LLYLKSKLELGLKKQQKYYVMNITNQRIISFFKEHPNLDPETIILRFIDIMESLNDSMNSSMNNSMVIDMLDKLKQLDNKIDNVSQQVNKITDDTQTQFTLKMAEFKKEYLAEVNMVLTCNVSDKIAPLIKEQNDALFNKTNTMIKDVIPRNETVVSKSIEKMVSKFRESVDSETKALLTNSMDKDTFTKYLSEFNNNMSSIITASQGLINEAISRSEEKLENKIDNIQQISANSNHNTISLHSSVGDLLKKFENSSAKGKMSENLLMNIIETLYPAAEVESVGQTKETGDIIMLRNHKPKILIENKLWNRSVVQAEVAKFIRDIEIQGCCGIFLSQGGKITTKDNFEINIHNGNVLVYVHDVNNDPDKIKLAVDIVDHLKCKLDEIDMDCTGDNISREILDYINAEYQNFVSSKTALIKLSKEFNKKLLKQIDDLKLPSLEDYLSSKFAFASNKFVCEFCGFVGKNQQSKSAHLRGCAEKKRIEASKSGQGDNIIYCETE